MASDLIDSQVKQLVIETGRCELRSFASKRIVGNERLTVMRPANGHGTIATQQPYHRLGLKTTPQAASTQNTQISLNLLRTLLYFALLTA